MFLSIVTRVYRRPTCLLANIASVARQTDADYEQVLLVDEEGRGMQWANGQLFRHRDRVHGDYVYILDDDNCLVRDDVVARLKAAASSRPDAIMVKFQVDGHGILPDAICWRRPPAHSHIDGGCVVVRRDLWLRHIKSFDQPIAGDYHFLTALWPDLKNIVWLDLLVGETQRVSRGKPE